MSVTIYHEGGVVVERRGSPTTTNVYWYQVTTKPEQIVELTREQLVALGRWITYQVAGGYL